MIETSKYVIEENSDGGLDIREKRTGKTFTVDSGDTTTGVANIDENSKYPNGIAIGNDTSIADSGNIAIGNDSQSSFIDTLAIGRNSVSDGQDSVAIGHEASANSSDSIAIGPDATSDTSGLCVIGADQLLFGGEKDTVDDADIPDGYLTVELDESNGAFRLRGRDSDGTLREASVSW